MFLLRFLYTARVMVGWVPNTDHNSLLHVAAMFMTMRVTVALVSGERVELCDNAEAGRDVGLPT